jgi:hypothetical protein
MRALGLLIILVLLILVGISLFKVDKPKPIVCQPCAECECPDCSQAIAPYKELAERCINTKLEVKSR